MLYFSSNCTFAPHGLNVTLCLGKSSREFETVKLCLVDFFLSNVDPDIHHNFMFKITPSRHSEVQRVNQFVANQNLQSANSREIFSAPASNCVQFQAWNWPQIGADFCQVPPPSLRQNGIFPLFYSIVSNYNTRQSGYLLKGFQ